MPWHTTGERSRQKEGPTRAEFVERQLVYSTQALRASVAARKKLEALRAASDSMPVTIQEQYAGVASEAWDPPWWLPKRDRRLNFPPSRTVITSDNKNGHKMHWPRHRPAPEFALDATTTTTTIQTKSALLPAVADRPRSANPHRPSPPSARAPRPGALKRPNSAAPRSPAPHAVVARRPQSAAAVASSRAPPPMRGVPRNILVRSASTNSARDRERSASPPRRYPSIDYFQ